MNHPNTESLISDLAITRPLASVESTAAEVMAGMEKDWAATNTISSVTRTLTY
jgi:hypothetical protein